MKNAPSFEPRLANFVALWKSLGGMSAAAFGDVDPGALAEQVFGPDMESARFFLYLFRRFGLPLDASHDAYKEACSYCFTTPRQDVFLRISIKTGSGTKSLFGYALTRELASRIREETDQLAADWRTERDAWASTNGVADDEVNERYKKECPEQYKAIENLCGPVQRECNEALLATLRDFLRPTYIRDCYFNPLGDIDYAALEYDEATDTSLYAEMPTANYCKSYAHEEGLNS